MRNYGRTPILQARFRWQSLVPVLVSCFKSKRKLSNKKFNFYGCNLQLIEQKKIQFYKYINKQRTNSFKVLYRKTAVYRRQTHPELCTGVRHTMCTGVRHSSSLQELDTQKNSEMNQIFFRLLLSKGKKRIAI